MGGVAAAGPGVVDVVRCTMVPGNRLQGVVAPDLTLLEDGQLSWLHFYPPRHNWHHVCET